QAHVAKRSMDNGLWSRARVEGVSRPRIVGVWLVSLEESRHSRVERRHRIPLQAQRSVRAARRRGGDCRDGGSRLQRASTLPTMTDVSTLSPAITPDTDWPITFDDVRAAQKRI